MDKQVAETVSKGFGEVVKTGLKSLGIILGCAVAGGVAAGVGAAAVGLGGWAVALSVVGGIVVGKLGGDILAAKYLASKVAPVVGATAGFLAEVTKSLETAPVQPSEPALKNAKDLGGDFTAANSNEEKAETAAAPAATAENTAKPQP